MQITMIEIAQLPDGGHNYQSIYGAIKRVTVPEGWAVVPEKMLPLENFPYGDVEVEEGEDGTFVVTKWSPLPVPPDPSDDPGPTEMDKIQAQVIYTAVMTDTLLVEEDET